jgi:hypothetical protein
MKIDRDGVPTAGSKSLFCAAVAPKSCKVHKRRSPKMNLNNCTDNIIVPRNIRRYPTELDRLPSRGAGNKVELRASSTFSDVAAAVNGANHIETRPTGAPASKSGKPFALWEKGDGFGFADLIDIINPLQHIPIVATIYRNFSDDHIGAAPRVIGGALWGRVGGFVAGLANAVVEWWSGKDIGDHIYAALFGTSSKDPNTSVVAQKKVAPSSALNGPLATPSKRRSGDAAIVTSAETPSAAQVDDTVDPNALRSEVFPLPRAARNSYDRIRKWGEPDESLGVRFPA